MGGFQKSLQQTRLPHRFCEPVHVLWPIQRGRSWIGNPQLWLDQRQAVHGLLRRLLLVRKRIARRQGSERRRPAPLQVEGTLSPVRSLVQFRQLPMGSDGIERAAARPLSLQG